MPAYDDPKFQAEMRAILSAITDVFKREGRVEEQIAAIKQVASRQRWTEDVFTELLQFAQAVAGKAPGLCQTILVAAVEAVEVTGDKRLEGTVAITAGNLMSALRAEEAALAFQIRAADAFSVCGAQDLRAAALANIGNELIRHHGMYARALEYYEEALPHFPDDLRANLLGTMGHALKKLNRFDEAVQRLREAAALDPSRSDYEIEIGECLRATGQGEQAAAVLKTLSASGGGPTANLKALLALANVHLQAGQWEDALQAYRKLLAQAEAAQSVGDQAAALHGIGNCYAELKQLAAAEESFRKALELAESVNDERLAAFCHEGVALILLRRDDNDAAQEGLRKAIALAQKVGDKNGEARLWGNLGIALHSTDRDKMREAVRAHERGIAIAREVGNAPEEARLTLLLHAARQASGWIDMLHGEMPEVDGADVYAEREKAIEAAINAAERAGDFQNLRSTLSNAGVFYEVEKVQFERAARYYERAIELHETLLTNVRSFEFQRNAGGLQVQDYAGMVHCCLQLGDVERAWWYVERGRARSLLRMLANEEVTIQVRGDEIQRDEFERISADLSWLLDPARPEGGAPRGGVDAEELLKERIRERDSLLREMRNQDPAFAALREVAVEPVEGLRELIPEGVAVIEYYLVPELLTRPEMTFAFVVTRDFTTCVDLQTTGARLDAMVREFRRKLLPPEMLAAGELETHPAAGLEDLAGSSWEQLSEELHALLIKPILHLLRGLKTLWLVPSGPLHYLPFPALRSGAYLVEQFALGVLPSANVLRFLRPWNPGEKKRLAAFVNPDCHDPALELPGTVREAAAIKLNGQPPQSSSGADATRRNIEAACATHDVVHIACHAHFWPEHPMLSSLRLAGPPGESGRWELRDIINQSVRASMIVLSACTSSYPNVASGEELLSLSYAFLHAGASTVIGSLWKVSDDACPLLMKSLYKHLGQLHVAQSLREAQLEMIRSAQHGHPRFWAAFHAVGISEGRRATTQEPGVDVPHTDEEFLRLRMLGEKSLLVGAYADAIRHLTSALDLKPDDATVWDLCGGAHQLKRNLHEAYLCYRRALELGRQEETLFVRAGTVCQLLGRDDEAEECYKKALSLKPTSVEALSNLAALLGQHGRFVEALEYADRAVRADESASGVLLNKAIILYDLDRIDESIALTRRVLESDADSASAHLQLGLCMARKLEISEARRCFLKTLDLDAGNERALLALQRLREMERELGSESISKEVDDLMRRAGQALAGGDKEEALSFAEQALQLAPQNALVWGNRGALQAATGQLSAARESLRRSTELDETDPDAWFNLARVQFQLGDFKEAAACVHKALKIDAEFVHALVLKAELLSAQGRNRQAIEVLEKASKLVPENQQIATLLQHIKSLTDGH
jgi:tetratricopeptide (TPR) repeat protein